jgi:hypothetical protein
MTVQIGPRHAVAPVTMVASQMAQNSSTGTKAQSAHRSRRGTGTHSRLHGWLRSRNCESTSEFTLDAEDRWRLFIAGPPVAKPNWLDVVASECSNTVSYLDSPIW